MTRRPYTAEQIAIVDDRIRRTCHRKQRWFVFDPAKRVSCLVGRGGGKTAAMLFRLLRKLVSRSDANCLFIAATRQSAERLVWRDLKRIVTESLRLSGAIFNETDLTLELPNGSRLMLFGCDDRSDIQKLRGITYHEVGVDEVASIKIQLLDELLLEVLGPRLVGTLCLIGTPGKRLEGLFYDATRPGVGDDMLHRPYVDRELPEYDGWDKWSSHNWSIEDGIEDGIQAMVEINIAQLEEKARNGWTDSNPYWLRERKGVWSADSSQNVYAYRPRLDDGHEWNQWSPKVAANGFAILPETFKDWGYGIGIDVGFKDAFALEVFAWSYSDPSRTLYHVFEIYRTRLYAQAIAKLLIGEDLNHDKYGGIVGAIGWPDAMVGDFAGSGGALLEELKTVYGIAIKAVDKPYKYKENAIELFNSDLFEGRIKIMKGSALAKEISELQWVVDAHGRRSENKGQANHACDAAMYIRNTVAPMLPSALATTDTKSAAPRPVSQRDPDDPVVVIEPARGDADQMYADEW